VLVGGEAGIGKSALVRAFGSATSGRVLSGACDAFHTPRPLGPW
jgi:predicted ATPase